MCVFVDASFFSRRISLIIIVLGCFQNLGGVSQSMCSLSFGFAFQAEKGKYRTNCQVISVLSCTLYSKSILLLVGHVNGCLPRVYHLLFSSLVSTFSFFWPMFSFVFCDGPRIPSGPRSGRCRSEGETGGAWNSMKAEPMEDVC